MPVLIEVHQLRTESDASSRGDGAVGLSVLEEPPFCKRRLRVAALVPEDPKLTSAELTDEKIAHPVTVDVADERGGMADFGIDELAPGLEPDGLLKFRGHKRYDRKETTRGNRLHGVGEEDSVLPATRMTRGG